MEKGKSTMISLKKQQGAALPLVLIVMILMIILSAAAYMVSQGNTGIVTMAASNEKALYAAEQGYNKTLWQLNSGENFLSALTPTETEYDGQDYNLYGLPSGANYRVNILVPLVVIAGQADEVEDNTRRIIRSTGWDSRYPDRLRSIEVEVYKKTFTQFVMANDSEKTKDGTTLYWLTNDSVYGPLHTNDTLYVGPNTPVFYGPVTYKNSINITPTENIYNPAIFRQGNAKTGDELAFGSSLNNLKAYARIDGHYYNGRTCIYLLADGGYNVRYCDQSTNPVRWYYNNVEYRFVETTDGNPSNLINSNHWRIAELENEAANSTSATMYQKIFRNENGVITGTTNFSSFSALAASVPSLSLPNNGVIYVDGSTGEGNSEGLLGDYTQAVSKYDYALGNVFVSGKLNGRLTIAAANKIFITAHNPCDWRKPAFNDSNWYDSDPGLKYANTTFTQKFVDGEWSYTEVGGSSGKDMLGLAAGNNVSVMHYNWPSQYNNYNCYLTTTNLSDYDNYSWTFLNSTYVPVDHSPPDDVYIQAAIYAQEDSFGYEAAQLGLDITGKGTCYMVGSIAQKYRGMQRSWGKGYYKNYSHDPRLLYDSPPHFPDPANTGWYSSRWDEINNHIQ
ncbi:MAG TPA: hypothetical protein PKN87_00995 [Syntrophomonadaceae bacterium]|nr:hypothetical protein [Syntrophomonadaceae bacterium]HPR94625.1 hypothetical protein [Syntrophomonadaceae bacterium]